MSYLVGHVEEGKVALVQHQRGHGRPHMQRLNPYVPPNSYAAHKVNEAGMRVVKHSSDSA
jgi:hypothetical protein